MNMLFEQRENFYCRLETLYIYWVGCAAGGGAVAYQMCVGSNLFKRKECFITDTG